MAGKSVQRTLLGSAALAVALSVALGGCAKGRSTVAEHSSKTTNAGSSYKPQTRTINMFAVPEWIGEMGGIPQFKEFAPKDFAKGGINDGAEVFNWQPQVIAACAGDTIKLAIGNPGPDDHTFTLTDFSVNKPIPAMKITNVSFKASKPGIYDYYCTVAEHTKYMHGTLMVFDDSDPMCGQA